MPLSPQVYLPDSSRRGVALIVTIILLTFLILLMVAMSSVVRVETQIATNNDALAQARQNALMGMNIALGKLQEAAGPDQRITARADLVENALNPARRYQMNLTGVWDSSVPGAPRLITWLVNGNEDLQGEQPNISPDVPPVNGPQDKANEEVLTFDASDDDAADHPASSPLYDDANPAEFEFDPSNVVAGGSNAPNFKFGDGHVYLVANGSVDVDAGQTNTIAGKSYKHAVAERVIVRKSPIILDGSKVAGKAPTRDVTIGHYAYWVGDAGIKASLAAANRVDQIDYTDKTALGDGADYAGGTQASNEDYMNRKMLHSLQLQGGRLDLLFRPDPGVLDIFANNNTPAFLGVPNSNRTSFYGVVQHPGSFNVFRRLATTSQLEYLIPRNFDNPDFSGVPAPPTLIPSTPQATIDEYRKVFNARLKQAFHDVTPQTYSVLTNMLTGGLKADLSRTGVVNALPASMRTAVTTYTNLWRPSFQLPAENNGLSRAPGNTASGLLRRVLETAEIPPALSATNSAYPIAPVITEFEMAGDLSFTASGVMFDVQCQVELWNPYNAVLDVRNNLAVIPNIVDNDPTRVIVDTGTTPTPTPTSTFSAEYTLAGLAHQTLQQANPDMTWEPGEFKVFFVNFQVPAKNGNDQPITGLDNTQAIQFTQYDQSKLQLQLFSEQPATPGAFDALAEFVDVGFQTVPAIGGARKSTIYYHFEVKNFDTNSAAWFSFDPRGPSLGDNETDGGLIDSVVGQFESGAGLFNTANKVVLFDVPRQEVISVGSLRHLLHTPGQAVYRIGSPADAVGVNYNNIFESHFFSSVPNDPNGIWTPNSGAPLANTSIVVYDPSPNLNTIDGDLWNDGSPPPGSSLTGLHGANGANAAQYLLVRDSFNINSTSVAAWRGMLAGSLPTLADPNAGGNHAAPYVDNHSDDYTWHGNDADPLTEDFDIWASWRYFDGAAAVTQPVRNAFFRFPHTASNVGVNYVTLKQELAASGTRNAASFKVGIRELTRAQIEELAWRVTYLLKNPPVGSLRVGLTPYKSLTQFVDDGILQKAIDEVGDPAPAGIAFAWPWANDKINKPGNVGAFIPERSPAFLTQGDILELIGHRLVARSDTFVIRAYGDVSDPDASGAGRPNVTARAWLEATVQRTPVKHSTANQADNNMTTTGSGVGNFGRQFKVLSLRWLRPDEI